MNRISRFKFAVALLAVILFMPAMASAQAFVSAPASTNLTYTVSEILTVTTDTPSLTLTTAQQSINVTTSWTVQSTRTAIATIAYFSSPTALSGSQGTIPASSIKGQGQDGINSCTMTSVTATYNGPSVGNNICANIFSVNLTSANDTGTHTSPFKIQVDPAAVIAPGTYTGTIFFIAAVS